MKINSLLNYLPFVFLLLCTSCFEIIEEISLNENGSGNFEFTANLSQSKTKLKSIMLMDKVNGYKVPSQEKITAEIDKICNLARNTNGISKVNKTIDFENFIFSFTCHFDSVESLNQVVKSFRILNKVSNQNHDNQYSYNKKSKTFTRNLDVALTKEYNQLKPEDKQIFKDAKFVSIYKFQNEIIFSSNSAVKKSPNKKAIMLNISILDIINKKKEVTNRVKLK